MSPVQFPSSRNSSTVSINSSTVLNKFAKYQLFCGIQGDACKLFYIHISSWRKGMGIRAVRSPLGGAQYWEMKHYEKQNPTLARRCREIAKAFKSFSISVPPDGLARLHLTELIAYLQEAVPVPALTVLRSAFHTVSLVTHAHGFGKVSKRTRTLSSVQAIDLSRMT